MKKIVFVHPAHFEQSMGGAEHQIALLINHLRKQFTNLEIYHIYEDNGIEVPNHANIRLLPLKKLKLNKRFGDRWFLHRKQILAHLEQIQPDIIYTRFYSSWSGLAADFAKKNNKIHIWALASDSDVVRLKKPVSFLKPLNKIENKWVRLAFKEASYIITQNNHQQELLRSEYGRDGILIRQSAEESEMEQSLKPNDRIRVCWIANLKPLKQPELFVQLANEFKEEQALEFVMIGRSEKQYDALIRDTEKMLPNFNYLGELSNDEVNKVLEESHILVNTSQYEGFSNTFIQAWMRKVAVISLNSNPDGLLSTGEIGFLAESMENMAAILKRMVKHPELVVEVGEKAYRHAMEFHSYAKNVEVLTKLMKIDE